MICRSVLLLPFPQIDVLPEVVRAVGGRVEVFMDGGVRQGTDVLKALAMGAKAVFVGRPVLWGLAYKVRDLEWSVVYQFTIVAVLQGSEGVEQVLQILKDEFKLAMMLSGRWFTLLAVLTKLFHDNFCLQVVHV